MKHLNDCVKPTSRPLNFLVALGLAVLILGTVEARATTYDGNDLGFNADAIGKGTLVLTDNGTTISGTLTLSGAPNDNGNSLVIYIDNGTGGGFSSTSGFGDESHANQITVSGVSGSGRSTMTFESGFSPQYAISLDFAASGGFGGVYKLANGGNNSLTFVGSVGLNSAGPSPYTFSFPATNIGLIVGSQATIKVFGTEISQTAYRSSGTLPGNDTGSFGQGYEPFTQTAYGTYVFDAGAPVLTPVTFQVDMSAMVANGASVPPGNVVSVTGSFGTSVTLTNNTNAANTNIYSGVAYDEDPAGTIETYKFTYYDTLLAATVSESSDTRSFTLQSGAQTLPVVYFSDLASSPSATTNPLTFQIDMTSEITLGNFNPNTQLIEVYGTFNQYYTTNIPAVPVQWTTGMGVLTNNPLAPNTNLYSGTFNDGNYPGSWEQYKYVMVLPSTSTNYESGANRDFNTPTGANTFPVAYFNNISNVVTVPVTFQVDMTSQIEAGNVNFGAGATVDLIGNWQNTPYSGVQLTNDPNAANTNIFSGTFVITAQPGSPYQYKFTIDNNGTTNYEEPVSTGGQNRQFILATNSAPQVLPLVFWSDEDPNALLPAATYVTFTVDMNGATLTNGYAFNTATGDVVMINGSFLPPTTVPAFAGGWNNALWTDPLPGDDYPAEVMTQSNLNATLYTNTFLLPAGSPVMVSYKYAVWTNACCTENVNCDNEAPANVNHTRYIRAAGNYSFPVDVFGQQTNNLAAATEISFGNLTVSPSTPGAITLNWLGRPGVYLQSCTNLAAGIWTTDPNSDGLSSSNIVANSNNVFFRLVNP